MTYENPWTFQDKVFTEDDIGDYLGFVYLITDTSNNKKYLGKKIFWNKVAKPPLKGKTKRRISRKPSNWQEYYGSNDLLKKLVASSDKSLYKREILKLCRTKSEMSYFETKLLFENDALLRDDFYNDWVTCKITRGQLNAIRDS